MDMSALVCGLALFAVGFMLGSRLPTEKAAKREPKRGAAADERERLEEAAAMENFFSYDGTEQKSPRDIAADRMVKRK